MVNFRDPAVVTQDAWAVVKFWHVVAGLYFWEFVTTLDYEWGVIRRRRPFHWTTWIYLITRISTLMAIILCLVGLDVTDRYNCELQKLFQYIFGYLAIAAASLLIVLRIVAIWNQKKVIIVIASGAWLINVAFLIQAIVRVRAAWVPAMDACMVVNMHITKLNLTVTLATDIILLFVMFIGLLRLRFHERDAFGLGDLLRKQGLIWLLVATIAEVLPVVLICLNLNDPFNDVFQISSMVTLSIAATRIHRGPVDYASASGCIELPSEPGSVQAVEWKQALTRRTTMSRVEVVINTTYEQDGTLKASQRGSLINVEGRLCEKPVRRPLDDVEIDVEPPTQVP